LTSDLHCSDLTRRLVNYQLTLILGALKSQEFFLLNLLNFFWWSTTAWGIVMVLHGGFVYVSRSRGRAPSLELHAFPTPGVG